MSLSHFDEKGGVVPCETEWGRWWQTVCEVMIEVDLEPGTRAKEIKVHVTPTYIECYVRGKTVIRGNFSRTVFIDETIWTVEEQKLLRIQLTKVEPNPDKPWPSLLQGQYIPNSFVFHEMRKKLDLEKFQMDNPGFDFSNATLTKCYDTIDTHLSRKQSFQNM